MDLTVIDVDRTIAGVDWRLRFSARMEALFETDAAVARRRHILVNGVVGLAAYQSFLATDRQIVGDVFAVSLAVHLLVMLPATCLLGLVIARTRRVWVREGALAVGVVMTTSAILLLTVISHAPLRDYEQFSASLGILFFTIVLRIRFWYATAACAVSLALMLAALSVVYAASPERYEFAWAAFVCLVTFALVGSYNLEREQRMAYLLRARDGLRTLAVEAAGLLDALTKVGNRRALDRAIEARERGSGAGSTAILLIDVDHFKAFNDTAGHQAGDDCLARIAGAIGIALREDDVVYRFGGEEFLVLLPETGLPDALAVAGRIHASIAAEAVMRSDRGRGLVTVSTGAAAGSRSQGSTIADLIGGADAALYAAKRDGRDRVRSTSMTGDASVVACLT